MAETTKTDNSNLRNKLALRRHFLRHYHASGPIDVLDCCAGSGVIWSRLRKEFAVTSYWAVDVKPKKGRLKIDSSRILAQKGWTQNVVDCDTYGSPWRHWLALLPNVARPVTVFLTIGQWQMGTDKVIPAALGLGDLKVPPGIAVKLHGLAVAYLLAQAFRFGLRIVEAGETEPGSTARYLGIRLEPASAA